MPLEIQLRNLVPDPLQERDNSDSQVWQEQVRLEGGSWIHVAAPSGSGKTTLGHILYGLRRDFSGEVYFSEKNISQFTIDDWAKLRQQHLSIIFQDLRLFDDYTGMENIKIKAGLTDTADDAEIQNMAERLGVQQLLNKACNKMSQGEKQRIAILRSLVQPFDWIIMDEPFSHLDRKNSNAAIALITEYTKKNSAGMIFLELGDDDYFPYQKKLYL